MPDASIALVSYNSKWPRRFEEERALLEPVLEPWLELHACSQTPESSCVRRSGYRLTANVTETTAVTSFWRDDVSLMPSLLTSVELRGVIW